MQSNINYYLKLFEGLRNKINFLLNKAPDSDRNNNHYTSILEEFSLMLMVSQDSGITYRWLLLEDQQKAVISRLKQSDNIKKIHVSPEQFFREWIRFKFGESGLIKYFVQTLKNTEFIKNFSDEKFLIKEGYELDYKRQPEFFKKRQKYRALLSDDKFDPFVELENQWGFKDVAFYYVKLPKLKDVEFVAVFPIMSTQQDQFFEKADFIFSLVKNATLGANLLKDIIDDNLHELYQQQLKTAIISILVDSFAHNISAHSLSALKWWFELRHKITDKRFFIDPLKGLTLSAFEPEKISINQNLLKDTTEKYYAALGLTDSIYNKHFFSLFDLLKFNTGNDLEKFFLFRNSDQIYSDTVKKKSPESIGKVSSVEVVNGEGPNRSYPICFNPRFPISLDSALYPFFRFLRDKGAFWSGVTRDMSFGGETKLWHQILWEDFANNPLYLGSIAKSEGITKLKFNLALKTNDKWISGRFVTIDLSLMDYEERVATNPKHEIEYQKYDFDCIQDHLCEIGVSKQQIAGKERNEIDDTILSKLDAKLKTIYFNVNKENLNHCKEEHVQKLGREVSEKCTESKDKFVNSEIYSKYAFVRLGKCFAHFREIMSTNDFMAFFPGGIVGEHALFTIFENTLRNIKHYKDEHELLNLRKYGIDFWISIEPEKLNITDVAPNPNKSHELFKVSVWLGHKTSKYIKEDGGNKLIWKKLSASTEHPILDTNGVPRMGGNSQDKICAAMLFNNNFNSVEDNHEDAKGKRNVDYFPWVHFSTNDTNLSFDSDKDQPPSRIKCRIDNMPYAAEIKKYKNSNTNQEVFLKKHFYLWKSDDYFIINSASELTGENISRFKFVIISNNIKLPNEQKEIINKARKEGIIRILYNNKDLDIDLLIIKLEKDIPQEFKNENPEKSALIRDKRLCLLYSVWLKQWLPFVNDVFKISFYKFPNETHYSTIELSETESFVRYSETKPDHSTSSIQEIGSKQVKIPLSHGGGDEFSSCNVRSHGAFWSKYFYKAETKQPEDLFDINVVDEGNKHLFMDIAEVIATKVYIFDNRLKSRMPINDIKLGVFEKNLELVVEEEKTLTEKGLFKKHLDKIINNSGTPNILVVHLSYIESLGYQEKTRGFMNLFIETELSNLITKDNFIFIIITGRGRNTWRDGLKEEYLRNTLFKPVESFIHAIESGISYNDNFDVKYNIIKVIFGS